MFGNEAKNKKCDNKIYVENNLDQSGQLQNIGYNLVWSKVYPYTEELI